MALWHFTPNQQQGSKADIVAGLRETKNNKMQENAEVIRLSYKEMEAKELKDNYRNLNSN